jgi:hypothetical protein
VGKPGLQLIPGTGVTLNRPGVGGADPTVRTVDGCRGLVNVQRVRPQTKSQWRAQAATEPVGTNPPGLRRCSMSNETARQAGGILHGREDVKGSEDPRGLLDIAARFAAAKGYTRGADCRDRVS